MEFGPFAVAIAFWAFVAIATVAGIVGEYKKRQLTLEPLRAAIDKGLPLDPAVVEKLMAAPREEGIKPMPLMVGGIICSTVGVGVCALAWFLSQIAPVAFWPILGGGVVILCTGLGLVLSARVVDQHRRRDATQA